MRIPPAIISGNLDEVLAKMDDMAAEAWYGCTNARSKDTDMPTKIDGKTPTQPARLTARMDAGIPKRTALATSGKPAIMPAVKVK